MSVLSNQKRAAVFKQLMAEMSSSRIALPGIQKADLKAACDAIDDGLGSVIATVNSLIPEPAKSGLTARQKLRLFLTILNARMEVS